jgi:hypothetical protein
LPASAGAAQGAAPAQGAAQGAAPAQGAASVASPPVLVLPPSGVAQEVTKPKVKTEAANKVPKYLTFIFFSQRKLKLK